MGSGNVSTQRFIIVKDRVEIYKDFAINLLNYIHFYYIDKESLSEDNDIRNHYVWCFNKVCDEFEKEGLKFKDNNELKEYYYAYYYNQFYKNEGNNKTLEEYDKFWRDIFEIDKQKNKNLINILIEIYTIYDKSISPEKNILEIV